MLQKYMKSGANPTTRTETSMNIDEMKSIIRRLFDEGFNIGNFSLADEAIDPDYIDHSTFATPVPGVEGFKMRIANFRKTFPDAHFTVDDIFAEGDRVCFRWTMSGTDLGGFRDRPPTSRQVVVTGINIERFAGGKIVEHWSSPDNLGLFQQLGIVPSPGQGSR